MKTGKRLLILSICLLLFGCQNEATTEEQRTDLSDDAAIYEAEDTENVEGDDSSDEDVTIISILGKEELIIENERIYDDKAGLGQLNNLFTLDEINTILNTIKGTWKIDEYVGFVSYDMYGRGKWIDTGDNNAWINYEGDTEWPGYMDDQKNAKANIPEFAISIKEYWFANQGVKDTSNNYIFVSDDNGRRYDSPFSIVLSMKIADDDYPALINRSMVGIGTGEEYPVIYIQFFSFDYSEENGEVIYEPATLVLTSDGQFLLLKDGAFYSLKKDIPSEIMNGNFEHLNHEDWKGMQIYYRKMQGETYLTWEQLDLNGDGIDDLILVDSFHAGKITAENFYSDVKRIVGIFTFEEDFANCVMWDDIDELEFSFYGTTGELMYYHRNEGTMVSEEMFEHYYYDQEWNKITDYRLLTGYVNSLEENDNLIQWFEIHPDIPQEEGIYYRKYVGEYTEKPELGEVLTYEELKEIYREEMGEECFSLHEVYE